jgi:DNA processing protein
VLYIHLASQKGAPPVLFCRGNLELLGAPGIGLCGSRNASEEGLRAARAGGEIATEENHTVISGYARGVDIAAHTAALASGGRTVICIT